MTRDEVTRLCLRILGNGYSIDEVAYQAGLPPSVIRHIQEGKLNPSPEIRARLAKALGVSEDIVNG